jgi:cytochrome c-type biogenesis protein CcmH/NrfF
LAKWQAGRAAKRRGEKKEPGFDFVKVLPILFGLAVVILVFALNREEEAPEPIHTHTPQALTASTDPATKRIAEQFNCPCGQCEHTLAECTCEHPKGAKEVKAFITHELLHAKRSEAEVVKLMDEKYGHKITM